MIRDTFESVPRWYKEIKHNSSDSVSIILIGNKCDLKGKRQVSKEEARKMAENLHLDYFETSAKSAKNVQAAFEALVQSVIEKGAYTSIGQENANNVQLPAKSSSSCWGCFG